MDIFSLAVQPDTNSVLLLAYALAGLIGFLGYRARALTLDGAVAACVVGGTIFGFGGLGCALLLILFFASSSALSFFKSADTRKKRASETFEKGGRRDAAQVLANGGVASLAALLLGLIDGDSAEFLLGAFVGALAAATADTWATEIGVLSTSPPRLVTSGKIVPAGTSGGVTRIGDNAAVLGATIVGVVAAAFAYFQLYSVPTGHWLTLVIGGAAGGTAGMLADSVLGATLQGSYWCPHCDKPTESRVHKCGTPTRLVRGLPWVNNDLVNLAGTAVGALVGGLLVAVL